MNQTISRQLLTAEARFRSQLSPYDICDRQRDTETEFSPSTSAFPANNIPPIYHIDIAVTTRAQFTMSRHR